MKFKKSKIRMQLVFEARVFGKNFFLHINCGFHMNPKKRIKKSGVLDKKNEVSVKSI